jgi:hypothetical protein
MVAAARLVAGWEERDAGRAPSAAPRADTRRPRADGPLVEADDELTDALADAREGDAASVSAVAVAMPSEVPTPRKIASAPTRPMYVEYPVGAFSVDGRIAPPLDHGWQGWPPELWRVSQTVQPARPVTA